MSGFLIREIQEADNEKVAALVRAVLVEMGVPKVGTAYADPCLDRMYEHYNVEGATYFVLEKDGELYGGAGIAQLDNYEGPVCELQKMYFLPQARSRGLGQEMITRCLQEAGALGYEQVYIETMPYMKAAQKLYVKNGFRYIDAPMGDTGHGACPVWLIKEV